MELEKRNIGHIPALWMGEGTRGGYLFLHGKQGRKEEAISFARQAVPMGYRVLAIDLPEHGERENSGEKLLPWVAVPEIRAACELLRQSCGSVRVRANSIGAWLAMEALQRERVEKALFVSPVVDMEGLIRTMMGWANVTEGELERAGEVPTQFGETLSWEYLRWVRAHPVTWRAPTAVLYGSGDTLISREMVDQFLAKTGGALTVMEGGEHWFHTPEQMKVLEVWERANL